MPDAATQAVLDFQNAPGYNPDLYSGLTTSTTTREVPTGPYPDRQLPSWFPKSADAGMGELMNLFGDKSAFDTTKFNAASEAAQSRVLATGMASASNAAQEYAEKTRQQGGSSSAAGVIKAQAQIGAMSEAGKLKMEQEIYNVKQREAAATHSAQIATTIAGLRNDYLKSLIGYTTSEDAALATTKTSSNAPIGGGGGGGGGGRTGSNVPGIFTPQYTGTFGPVTGYNYLNPGTGVWNQSPAPNNQPQTDMWSTVMPGG